MQDEIINDILRDMETDAEAAWEGTPLRRALVKYAARLREALAASVLVALGAPPERIRAATGPEPETQTQKAK